MYLREFGDVNYKNEITDVLLYCALANGEFVDEEKKLVSECCDEMKSNYYEEPKESLKGALEVILSKCTNSEKKKLLTEFIAIMLSDGSCDDKEMEFLKTSIIAPLGISIQDFEDLYKALRQLYIMYGRLNDLVLQ